MQRFSDILFVAGSESNDLGAFSQALSIANNNQAKITVVAVVDVLNIEKAHAFALDDQVDMQILVPKVVPHIR